MVHWQQIITSFGEDWVHPVWHKQKLKVKHQLDISCGNTKLTSKSSVGYLGVDLDQSLSGDNICNSIVQKSNSRLKFLYRQASFLNLKTRKQLVSALIQCHFDYACSSWYFGISQKYKLKLQVCQNKLIRFVLGLHPRSHIGTQQFRTVGWLPVEKRVWHIGLTHIHKMLHGQAPTYLASELTRIADTHTHMTRSSQHGLVMPSFRSSCNGIGHKTFFYNAIKMWNNIPSFIQSIETTSRFKMVLKKHLFQ